MTGAVIYPTADQIAHAIVAASREFGEDPIKMAEGRKGSSARYVAYAALRDRFSSVPDIALARMLGLKHSATSFVGNARYTMKLPYWADDRAARVKRVIAAIPDSAPPCATPASRAVVTVEADAAGAPSIAIKTNAGVLRTPAPKAPIDEKGDDRVVRRGPPLKPKPLPLRAPHRSTASLLEEAARGLGIPVVVKPLPPGARRVMPHVVAGGDHTSSILGDPPPGRSALDRRQPRE